MDEIQVKYISNTSLEHYHFTDLLSV